MVDNSVIFAFPYHKTPVQTSVHPRVHRLWEESEFAAKAIGPCAITGQGSKIPGDVYRINQRTKHIVLANQLKPDCL